MEPFESKCPHCNAVFEAEEEWVGQIGECPGCNKEITIEKPVVEQKPQLHLKKKYISDDTTDKIPSAVSKNTDEMNCPYCGETIKSVAIKCRFCQSPLKRMEPTVDPKYKMTSEQPPQKVLEPIKNEKSLTTFQLWTFVIAGIFVALWIIIFIIIAIPSKTASSSASDTVEKNVHTPYQYQYDLGRKWAKEAVNMGLDDGNKTCYYLKGIKALSNSFDPYEEQKKDAFTKGWQSVDHNL
jgi:DNA-directed RNA polymerase subunit M/transcription elongation factor TFIIS